ncbi:response regulator [Phenylobacterium sp.]|uniref:hybrid sensor histidine kinase/response regulator n=1 Tax=Phenylobacterium sp. TaxID=1871053 RepID=UPI00378335A4
MAMASAAEQPAADGGASPRILIVDDVADNRTILRRRFERRGFTIAEAESGGEALEQVAAETFDVVLLDVMMPDMNGLEVLRRIRQTLSDVQLPVIMVTGKTESQDIVEALTAGANDYITKPVDFAVALARVSTQVRARQAEEQVRLANEALSRVNEDLERRIAERTEQLRAALIEAQAANKAKDEFLVIVSHELRTPLNGIVGMGQVLGRTSLTDQQRQMADIINTSADQLHGVVADLLDTLDLKAGGLALDPKPTPIAPLLAEVAQGATAKAQAKGLAFRLDAPADLGTARVDGRRLAQVLAKLLDNAVKFTDAGEVTLSAHATGGRLVFEVADTGVGFDAETAGRLFHAFEQADASLTRRHGGLGLGLAISAGLVGLMGGTLTAEGRPDQGATFRVKIPAA